MAWRVRCWPSWNGIRWKIVPSPNVGWGGRLLTAVAARTATDVWAVGQRQRTPDSFRKTLIEHWNGTRWKVVRSPNVGKTSNILLGVAVISARRAWAVGQDSDSDGKTLAERWNGTRWRVARTPSPGSGDDGLSGIAEIPHRGGFWAVGNAGNSTLIEFHC